MEGTAHDLPSDGRRGSWWHGVVQRLDHLQRRHTPAGFPIAVVYKYVDDQGSYLAALVTYYGFLSLFPLLLLLSSLLGFALQGDPHLQQQILRSTLSQFPVIGTSSAPPGCAAAASASRWGCWAWSTAGWASPRRCRTS